MRVGFFLSILLVTVLRCSPTPETTSPVQTEFSSLPDSILDRAADSLGELGNAFNGRRSYDSAMIFYNAALSLRKARGYDDLQTVKDYRLIGQSLSMQMKSNDAFEAHSEAKRLAEANNAPLDTKVSLYLSMAGEKRELLDYASSTSLALHALSLVRQHDPGNSNLLARCYRNLGALYHAKGSYWEAITEFRRAIALYDRENTIALASVCFNSAIAFEQLGLYDSSLSYFDKALAFGQDSPNKQSDYRSSIYVNKGGIFIKKNQYDSARVFLKNCLAIRREIWGEKHMLSAGAYHALGFMYDSMGLFDSAMYCYQSGLRSAIRNFNEYNPMSNPRPDPDELTMDLVDYLVSKASVADKLSRGDTTRGDTIGFQMMELAVNTYLLADSVFSVLLSNEVFEDAQISHLDVGRIPYAKMMALTTRLYAKTNDRRQLDRALHIMERSKAIVLKKALRRLESFSEVGVSPALLREQNKLVEARSVLVQALMLNPQPGPIRDSISESIIKVNENYRDLQQELDAQRSQDFLNEKGSAISLDGMMTEMRRRRSHWVEYLWSDETIYVLSISPQSTKLLSIPVTAGLVRTLTNVLSELREFDNESLRKESFIHFANDLHVLYRVLLEPVLSESHTTNLIISPSGPLMALPFEALVVSQPDFTEVSYKLPYLVWKRDISYQYSASLVDNELTRRRHGDRLLAVAYSDSGIDSLRGGAPADLPGTRDELRAISDVMAGEENLYLMDRDASESAFKEQAEDFNLLHLAIHGESDTINAMNSRLVFANGGADSEDGFLYAHELYALDLRTVDLTVLTACESGVGKMQSGEGMMSIARGFAYAGCPSLVVSLWKISDKTAPPIVSDFYTAVSEGININESLGEAKRRYLKDTGIFNAHPFYWAAFLAVGETSAVTTSDSRNLVTLVLTGMIAAFVLWVVMRFRRMLQARFGLQRT